MLEVASRQQVEDLNATTEVTVAPVRVPAAETPHGAIAAWRFRGNVGYARAKGKPLFWLSILLVVLLPTAVVVIYTSIVASPQFVAEYRVAVRSVQPIKTGGMADLFGFAGVSQAGNDSNAVVQYLQSRQAIEDLGDVLRLRSQFEASSVDWLSRLRPAASIEEFTRYWDHMVDAYYESSTGTTIVRVTTFGPETSYDLANRLLANSEKLVNRLSERARGDSVLFAQGEVAKAEERLGATRAKARTLQDSESVLDAQKQAEATMSLAAKLKEQIAKLSADLFARRAQLASDAPSVRSARENIAGLQREYEKIEGEATFAQGSDPGGKPLSSILGAFQQLNDERQFAEKAYQSALASLETARMDANKQQIYLATIVRPGLPEEASFPKPLRQTGITLAVALAIWLVGLLVVHSVREHM